MRRWVITTRPPPSPAIVNASMSPVSKRTDDAEAAPAPLHFSFSIFERSAAPRTMSLKGRRRFSGDQALDISTSRIRRNHAASPLDKAIRLFLDFMRIGDTESAYQAVEKMKFSDFVDSLEVVHCQRKTGKHPSERKGHDRSHQRKYVPELKETGILDEAAS